jgi:hypothetical protein
MYPSRNTSTYTSPSKNTNTQTNESFSSFQFLMIDDTYFFKIDDFFLFLIENPNNWNYQAKS